MTQYKTVKISEEDYNTLKRYMHLGFTDSMAEAFHKAINTAMFEEFGEPTPAAQRKEWERESILPQQDLERATGYLPTPEQQKERIEQATKKRGRPKGVKNHVPHTKRDSKRKTKGERP